MADSVPTDLTPRYPAAAAEPAILSPVGFGAWAFAQRSWLPVPFAIALVVLSYTERRSVAVVMAGTVLILAGQALRLWAVRHIGGISRTRSMRLGPLITTGPYAWIRNPLYVGNLLLWMGFVLCSGLLWMIPVAWSLFAVQYGSIAAWEHHVLHTHYAEEYAAYARDVAAWLPRRPARDGSGGRHPWRAVLFSERGTFLAIAFVALLLAMKVWMRV